MPNKEIAFLIGRIILGINFFSHGIVRIPKISAFSAGMVKGFEGTFIGFAPLISAFAHGLVFVELLVGLALLAGYKTKYALIFVSCILMTLIFGASMKEDWDLVGSQMIYVIFVYMMIRDYQECKVSLDYVLKK